MVGGRLKCSRRCLNVVSRTKKETGILILNPGDFCTKKKKLERIDLNELRTRRWGGGRGHTKEPNK